MQDLAVLFKGNNLARLLGGLGVTLKLSLLSVALSVALADLMYVAKDLIGMYYKTDEALLMLTLAYLALLLPLSVAFSLLERRLRHAGFGGAV